MIRTFWPDGHLHELYLIYVLRRTIGYTLLILAMPMFGGLLGFLVGGQRHFEVGFIFGLFADAGCGLVVAAVCLLVWGLL